MNQKYVKSILRTWLLAVCTVMLGLLPFTANAQSITVNGDVISANYHPDYGGYHNILDDTEYQIIYSFTPHMGNYKITEVIKATYTFGDQNSHTEEKELKFDITKDGELVIEPLVFTQEYGLHPGEYTLSYEIQYKYTVVSGEPSKEAKPIRDESGFKVKIWPAVTYDQGQSEYKDIADGETVVLGPIVPSGGNDSSNAWKVEWPEGCTPKSDGFSCEYTVTADDPSTKIVTAKLINYAPGTSKAWCTKEIEYSISKPAKGLQPESPLKQALFVGQSTTLKVSGEEGWTLVWYKGEGAEGEYLTGGESYVFTAKEAGTYSFHCYVDKYGYECSFTVIVYPAPTVKITQKPNQREFMDGQIITFEADTTGGAKDKWTFSWENQDKTQKSLTQQFTLTANNKGTEPKKECYVELTARNIPEDLKEANILPTGTCKSETYTIWPKATCDFKFNDKVFNNGETRNCFVDDEVKLEAIPAGGTDAWDYEWVIKAPAGIEETRTTKSCTFNVEKDGRYTITAKAYNILGTDRITVADSTLYVQVYAKASLEFKEPSQPSPLSVYVDNEVEMMVEPSTGNLEDWSEWEWRIDDGKQVEEIKESNKYTFKKSNAGTYTIVCSAKNRIGSSGELRTVKTPPYIIIVVEKPEITEPYHRNNDVRQGRSVTIGVNHTGGLNKNGWSFVWEKKDGKPLDHKESTLTIDNAQASDSGTYTLTVSYKEEDGTIYLEPTVFTFDITVFTAQAYYVENGHDYAFNDKEPIIVTPRGHVEMKVLTPGTENKSWSFEWRLDDVQVSFADNWTFYGDGANTNQTYKVDVIATNSRWTLPWSFRQEIKVVDMAVAPIDGKDKYFYTSTQQREIGVTTYGGEESGWSFAWTHGSTTMPNEKGATIKQVFNTPGTERYKVVATYNKDGVTFSDDCEFIVNVYPEPKAELIIEYPDMYYGEVAKVTVVTTGGNPDGWTYNWNSVGNFDIDASTAEFEVKKSPETDYIYSSVVYAENTLNTADIQSAKVDTIIPMNISIHAWSRGKIEVAKPDSTELYHETANMELRLTTIGGYPGKFTDSYGWRYEWKVDGNPEGSTNPFVLNKENTGTDPIEFTVSYEARNTLNGVTGCDTTGEYAKFKLWPQVKVSRILTLEKLQVREGTAPELKLSQAPTGGYQPQGSGNWEYTWTSNGATLGSESVVKMPAANMSGGTGKDIQTITVGLDLKNMGPYGNYWYDNDTTYTIRVYRAPQVPGKMVQKGNGTSCIYIAMMDNVPDEELSSNGYSFVFGYDDDQGAHAMAPTTSRYCQFTYDVFHNPSNKFWVYTQWTFDDGSVVTSNKRKLDGKIDDFDGSVFIGGGRGDGTSVKSIGAGSAIESDGRYFKAAIPTAAPAYVMIYSASGYLVRTVEYASRNEFDETIDFGTLVAGMYIVEIRIGDLSTVRKVVVDKK